MIIVTSSTVRRSLAVKAVLTEAIMHEIGEIFCNNKIDTPFAGVLRSTFGNDFYRWYCMDLSEEVKKITFSRAPNPETYKFRGVITQVAEGDRVPFVLYSQECDIVLPGKRNRTQLRPFAIVNDTQE